MTIEEILRARQNITIAININDLREFANFLIDRTRRDLEKAIIDDKVESYPNQKQVAAILNVSPSTLTQWNKKGVLRHAGEVGRERRYKMSDVKALLNNKAN